MVKIDMLNRSSTMHQPCSDDLDDWSKDFCINTIVTGVNKLVSNETNIAFYDSVMKGVQSYHRTVLKDIKVDGEGNCTTSKSQINLT